MVSMGVAIPKSHPLIHPLVDNNTHQVTRKLHGKFQPGWSINSFWQPKQLTMGVAMAKPHPCILNNAHPVIWKLYAKFQSSWTVNYLLVAKTTSCKYSYSHTIPVGTHVFNNAYPVTWKPHGNFSPVGSLISFR